MTVCLYRYLSVVGKRSTTTAKTVAMQMVDCATEIEERIKVVAVLIEKYKAVVTSPQHRACVP